MKWFKFSQRIGKTPIKNVIQIDGIDTDLKNHLWNAIIDVFKLEDNSGHNYNYLSNYIWATFFNKTKDMIPSGGYYSYFRNWFFEQAQWHNIYDFIEYLCLLHFIHYTLPKDIQYHIERRTNICEYFNNVLEQELSGYRIIDNQVIPITSEPEIAAINDALANSDKYHSVNKHLKTAIDYLSDKQNPDYRNCIKESISAVEAFCKIITNKDKATLGDALKEIEKKITIHTALKDAFSKIYGYTSDSAGIRHSLTENDNTVTQEDAIFMLVACSAFINYLKSKTK
jgi:hypothetical protein